MSDTNTPWGYADTVRPIAPGITWYSTSSHGGIGLSAERLTAMPTALRSIHPWAGEGWYEEDCDWSIAVAAFAELFTARELHYAARTLPNISYAKSAVAEFMATSAGQTFNRLAAVWQPSTSEL